MADIKVEQFIRNLEEAELTADEIAIVKAHHEYQGDKQIKIVGALPHRAAFVNVVDHIGYSDSVIDRLCYENDCSEDCFIHSATERREINLIKKWLNNNLSEPELQKLVAEGKL